MKRGYIWRGSAHVAAASRKQEFLKKLKSSFELFPEKFQSLYFENSLFFYNCEAVTNFLQILSLTMERLKFSFRLRISFFNCRRHILPQY